MNAIALGMMLVSSLLTAAPGEEDLGDVGESCRSRADCRSGLKCLANVCKEESREGLACGATRECGGGGLRCLEHVCKVPAAAAVAVPVATYVPPPPPEWSDPTPRPYVAPAQYAAVSQYPQASGFSGPPSASFGQTATVDASARPEESTLEGTHGYVGGIIGIGPGVISGGGGGGAVLAVPFAAQGGAWFGRFDLQFELAPFTDLAIGNGVVPSLGLTAKPGLLAVMHQRGDFAVGWMFRLGLGVGLVGGGLPAARVYAQLIGVGVRSGRMHMEFGLPLDAYLGAASIIRLPLTFSMTYVF